MVTQRPQPVMMGVYQVRGVLGKDSYDSHPDCEDPHPSSKRAPFPPLGLCYLIAWPCRLGLGRPMGTVCKEMDLQHQPVRPDSCFPPSMNNAHFPFSERSPCPIYSACSLSQSPKRTHFTNEETGSKE